jgi:hypothetical protein
VVQPEQLAALELRAKGTANSQDTALSPVYQQAGLLNIPMSKLVLAVGPSPLDPVVLPKERLRSIVDCSLEQLVALLEWQLFLSYPPVALVDSPPYQ